MIHNCYTCRLPEYHASCKADSEGSAKLAWFACPIHGNIGSDEVDGEFQCNDWQPQEGRLVTIHAKGIPSFEAYLPSSPEIGGHLLAAAWRIRHQADVYDNLAAQTSPQHARQRTPEMVKAGVTSCGVALVL